MKRLNKIIIGIIAFVVVIVCVIIVNFNSILYAMSEELYLLKAVEKNFSSLDKGSVINLEANLELQELVFEGSDYTDKVKKATIMCDGDIDIKNKAIYINGSGGVGNVKMYQMYLLMDEENIIFKDEYFIAKPLKLKHNIKYGEEFNYTIEKMGSTSVKTDEKTIKVKHLRLIINEQINVDMYFNKKLELVKYKLSSVIEGYECSIEGNFRKNDNTVTFVVETITVKNATTNVYLDGKLDIKVTKQMRNVDGDVVIYDELDDFGKKKIQAQIELKLGLLKFMVPENVLDKLKTFIKNIDIIF